MNSELRCLPASARKRQALAPALALAILGATADVTSAADSWLKGIPDGIAMSSPSGNWQVRLHTNAAPDAAHLLNSLEFSMGSQVWLTCPSGDGLKQARADSKTASWLQALTINNQGPRISATNGLVVLTNFSSKGWAGVMLDGTATYRDSVSKYRRSLLVVEPDLLVVHDRFESGSKLNVALQLHPPAETRVDEVWKDLRWDGGVNAMRIAAPARRHQLRSWECATSPLDALLPGTSTMRLNVSPPAEAVDLITVFAMCRKGESKDYQFRMVESNTAVGVRVHRQGWPTLVAFNLNLRETSPSLDSFAFSGPAGVHVFGPKARANLTEK